MLVPSLSPFIKVVVQGLIKSLYHLEAARLTFEVARLEDDRRQLLD